MTVMHRRNSRGELGGEFHTYALINLTLEDVHAGSTCIGGQKGDRDYAHLFLLF